jgi:hypothetical protein
VFPTEPLPGQTKPNFQKLVFGRQSLSPMLMRPNMMAAERALTTYGALAKHSATQETKRDLTLHLRRLYESGERDQSRLTVLGLSFLRDRDIEIKRRRI